MQASMLRNNNLDKRSIASTNMIDSIMSKPIRGPMLVGINLEVTGEDNGISEKDEQGEDSIDANEKACWEDAREELGRLS